MPFGRLLLPFSTLSSLRPRDLLGKAVVYPEGIAAWKGQRETENDTSGFLLSRTALAAPLAPK